MDSQNRCIPGIMYIPNYLLLEQCLQNFQKGLFLKLGKIK